MASDVTVRMSAENAEMTRAWLESQRGPAAFGTELDKVAQKATRAGRATKDAFGDVGKAAKDAGGDMSKAGDEAENAFGTALVTKLTAAVGALALLKQGVTAVTQSWSDYLDMQSKALEASKGVGKSSDKLSQLAKTPEELKGLHRQRDDLAVTFNMEQAPAAEGLFNAKSAGLDDSEIEAAGKGTVIGDDFAGATGYMGSIKQIYHGKVDPKAAYNVAMQAAADSPNLEMSDVTTNLPSLMAPGDKLGLGVEEVAAMYSEGSAEFGKTKAADRYRGLLGRLATFEEFQGQGMAGIEKYAAMSADEQEKFIGNDQEKIEATDNLKRELADIKASAERYKTVAKNTGTKDDLLDTQVEIHKAVPRNVQIFDEGVEEKRLAIAEQNAHTAPAAERSILNNRANAEISEEGGGWIEYGLSNAVRGANYYMPGSTPESNYASAQFGRNLASPAGWGRNAKMAANDYDRLFGVDEENVSFPGAQWQDPNGIRSSGGGDFSGGEQRPATETKMTPVPAASGIGEKPGANTKADAESIVDAINALGDKTLKVRAENNPGAPPLPDGGAALRDR